MCFFAYTQDSPSRWTVFLGKTSPASHEVLVPKVHVFFWLFHLETSNVTGES